MIALLPDTASYNRSRHFYPKKPVSVRGLPDRVNCILGDRPVHGKNRQVFQLALCDEHAVKGITV